jgi:hypothetical protein
MKSSDTNIEAAKDSFHRELNSNGFGFQYAVLDLANSLYEKQESAWQFEAAEFPVRVQQSNTHIDFILQRDRSRNFSGNYFVYLVAECKRANPAHSNWCFVRAPYTYGNKTGPDPWLIEQLSRADVGHFTRNAVSTCARRIPTAEYFYHIAMEVKTGQKGDEHGYSKGKGIEDATSQVCRGVGGLAEFIAQNLDILLSARAAIFIPVIFTTAKLFVTDADLSTADLQTGNIDLSNTEFVETPYLFYQYNLSPVLKHSLPFGSHRNNLSKLLESAFVRTIAIVSAAGIEHFLQWSSEYDFGR